MTTDTTNSTGIAYKFFNCRAESAQAIEAVLPDAKHASEASSGLEISVIDGLENLPQDTSEEIMKVALKEAKPAGIRYAMQAKLPGATNTQTAIELHTVVSMMYNEPSIYRPGDKLQGLTVWQDEATDDILSQE